MNFEKILKAQKIEIIQKEMPDDDLFICFEDEDVKIKMQFNWEEGQTAMVESIDFTLENKPEKNFGLHDITACEHDEYGTYYRMNIITEPQSAPTLQTSAGQVLGNLDMSKGKHVLFLFNVISESEVDYYQQHSCEFNLNKTDDDIIIRSKDGSAIQSI